jgi:palmitoyltransferase
MARRRSGQDGSSSKARTRPSLLDLQDLHTEIREYSRSAFCWAPTDPPFPFFPQDHHCPWLNQCVGLGNERYFVLFMSWLCIACVIVTGSGWQVAYQSIRLRDRVREKTLLRSVRENADIPSLLAGQWPHPYTPRVFVLLTWVLAAVMAVGLGVMSMWQLVLVAHGETSVESHDNAHYEALSKRRGKSFANVYDLGPRRNLELFFNVGEDSV